MSETTTDVTLEAVLVLRETGGGLASCLRAEGEIALERAELLEQITASLIGNDNPMTNKPHSATSAREAAERTPQYVALKRRALDAEVETMLARVHYETARVLAWATVREG